MNTEIVPILDRSGSMQSILQDTIGGCNSFLSADFAALGDAEAVGIARDSTLLFEKSGQGTAKVRDSLSARTSDYRSSRKQTMEFEAEDREKPGEAAKPER